jgi:hypothetical protein
MQFAWHEREIVREWFDERKSSEDFTCAVLVTRRWMALGFEVSPEFVEWLTKGTRELHEGALRLTPQGIERNRWVEWWAEREETDPDQYVAAMVASAVRSAR